jgi:hypothetical protein
MLRTKKARREFGCMSFSPFAIVVRWRADEIVLIWRMRGKYLKEQQRRLVSDLIPGQRMWLIDRCHYEPFWWYVPVLLGVYSVGKRRSLCLDTFIQLADGKLNGQKAFMTGALKVKGNVMLAVSSQALYLPFYFSVPHTSNDHLMVYSRMNHNTVGDEADILDKARRSIKGTSPEIVLMGGTDEQSAKAKL